MSRPCPPPRRGKHGQCSLIRSLPTCAKSSTIPILVLICLGNSSREPTWRSRGGYQEHRCGAGRRRRGRQEVVDMKIAMRVELYTRRVRAEGCAGSSTEEL